MRGRPHGAAPTTGISRPPSTNFSFLIFNYYQRGLFARTERSRPFPTNFYFLISNYYHARAATWGRPYDEDFPSHVYEFPISNFKFPLGRMFFAGERRPQGTVTSDAIRAVPYKLSNFRFPTAVRAGGHMGPPLPSLRGKRGVRPACDEAIQKRSVRFIAKSGRRRSGLPRFARKDGGWIAAQFDRLSMTIQYNQLKARQRERGLFARTEWSHRMRSEPFPTSYPISNHHHARAATWSRPYNGDFPFSCLRNFHL